MRPTTCTRLGLIALAMGLAPMASAQVLDPDLPAPNQGPMLGEPSAELVFEQTEHEFGRVTDERKVETTFAFRNTGSAPLEIKQVRAGCGCTIPKMSKKVYAPGERGEIKVQFDPSKKRGLTRQRITVMSNDPDRPSRVLQIGAEVIKLVEFNPLAITLQRIYRGDEHVIRVQAQARSENFEVTELELTGENIQGITAELGQFRPHVIDGEKATLGEIIVTIDSQAQAGVRRGKLVMRTNDSRKPLVTLNLTGEIRGDLTSNPVRVSLGGLVMGETYERKMTVTSRSGRAFDIKNIRFEGSNADGEIVRWSSEVDQRNPAARIVVLDFIAPDRRGVVRGDLILETTLPDEPQVKIPLSGAVRR
ncbi:MAG: DUF1573 domain-containing protein [Planctomycetota bacterium]